jgi:hypothetical protein
VTTVEITIGTVAISKPDTSEYHAVDAMCSVVLRKLPHVQRLVFTCAQSGVLHPAAVSLLRGLQDLRAVNFMNTSELPGEVLFHLAHLPKLHSFRAPEIIPTSQFSLFTTNIGHFPSLDDFSIFFHDWPSATTLINSMRCPFKHLKVKCYDVQHLSAVEEFIAASITRLPFMAASLLSIDLSTSPTLGMPCFRYACTTSEVSAAFRPLLSCSQLRFLKLCFPFVDLLDDVWVTDEVATAWPLMEKLHLHQNSAGTGPKMTASGLSSLIRTHTRLRDIHLPLDITSVQLPSQVNNVFPQTVHFVTLDHHMNFFTAELHGSWMKRFPHLEMQTEEREGYQLTGTSLCFILKRRLPPWISTRKCQCSSPDMMQSDFLEGSDEDV